MSLITGQGTLTKTFLERVRATPDVVGFRRKIAGAWESITFKAYHDDCKLLSLGLSRLGVKPSDRVALLSNTRYEWPLMDMAILGARAVTVPIYPSSTAADVAYILNHSGSSVAIVENSIQLEKLLQTRDTLPTIQKIVVLETSAMALSARYPEASKDVLTLDALRELGRRVEARDANQFERNLESAKPEDPITICYTSGTTGVPKGAILTHANLMSALEDCVEVLARYLKGDTYVLSFLPFSHILGKVESCAIYIFGWNQAFCTDLDHLIADIQEIRPTLLFAVPRIFEKAYAKIQDLLKDEFFGKRKVFEWGFDSGRRFYSSIRDRRLPKVRDIAEYTVARTFLFRKVRAHFGGRLKFAVCGGAPLAANIGEFFQVAGLKIMEGYGLTETCGPVAVNTPADPRFGTVGKPLPDVSIKIAKDGEILIKSKKVFQGYYKMPSETAEVLQGGWFHTGDIGVIDDDGFLSITDRKKDIIITSGGKNVSPQKIENLAKQNQLITQFLVYGDNRPYLTALITLDAQRVIQFANENHVLFSAYAELIKNPRVLGMVEQIIAGLNEQLASYEKIKKFLIVPQDFSIEGGELTPSLKVRRRIATQNYRDELGRLYI